MAFFHDMRNSRTVKFLTVHAITSLVAGGVMLSRSGHVHQPFFPPYFAAFSQSFFGALAAAFLSLNQLVLGLFRGFAGSGEMLIAGRPFPLPVIAGVLSLGGIILAVAGKQMYRSKAMYLLFFLASLLFLTCAYVFFVDMGEHGGALLGHPAFLQPEK